MNARQKAKHYKKLYERMAISPRFEITKGKIETVKIVHIVSKEQLNNMPIEWTLGNIAEKIGKEVFLKELYNYRIEEDYLNMGTKITAWLNVVKEV